MNIQLTKPNKWWYWYATILLLPMAVGVGAVINLAQSPESPDCLGESSTEQEAASVFYCATALAAEPDINKLSQAIVLVNNIPKHHPLHNEKLLKKWSLEALELSETAFQAGEISIALDTAKMIPLDISTHQIAMKKLQRWQSIWSKAEAISQAAKEIIEKDNNRGWYSALSKAKELRRLDNNYWASTKYQELVHYIQDVKEKNDEMKHLEKTEPKPIATPSISRQETVAVPSSDEIEEKEDVAKLKKARILASSGKIEDMKAAVDEAYMIISDNQYEKAQTLITELNRKIQKTEDSSYLETAKKLAAKNDVISLEMAITQASLISYNSNLHHDADKNIEQWRHKIWQMTAKSQPAQEKIFLENDKTMPDGNSSLDSLEDLELKKMP